MIDVLLLILTLAVQTDVVICDSLLTDSAKKLRSEVIFDERNFCKYSPLIYGLSERQGVDPKLVQAMVIVESKFNPRAGSRKGALGLMQLMPATARELGVKDRLDPEQNLRGGIKYLKKMLIRFKNDTKLAIAAYNAGPRKVLKYKGIPPYVETQKYVKKVMYIHSLL